jgi:DNA-directed RNA polymerase subunit M/transcription elongation factor TFIIS
MFDEEEETPQEEEAEKSEDAPADEPAEEVAEEAAEVPAAAMEGGRWVCPKCGNNNPRMIREETDKSVLLNAYPPVYGKKLKCGQCGNSWRHK